MYLAARRQSNSTRMVGIIGAVSVMAAVGAVLATMKETIIPIEPPRNMILIMPEEPVPPPKVEKVKAPKEDTKPVETPQIEIPPPVIDIEPLTPPEAPPVTFTENPAPPAEPAPAPAAVGPPATRPRLNAGAKPEYPGAAMRAKEQGTTTLNLCVSKTGQVTQASVSGSSGSPALDQAALAWIKRERFKPGTENGQPVDMCDHSMAYVWQLPKA